MEVSQPAALGHGCRSPASHRGKPSSDYCLHQTTAPCHPNRRAALAAVLNRIGWAAVHPPGLDDEPLLQALPRLTAERDETLAEAAVVRASTLRRITSPLRRLSRYIRRR